jgi:hypothetical protein
VTVRTRGGVSVAASGAAWLRSLVLTALLAACTSQGVPSSPSHASSAETTKAPPTTEAPAETSAPPTETEPAETASNETPNPETPAPVVTPTPQPTPIGDSFGRHDVPPGDVAAQLTFIAHFDRPCGTVYGNLGPGQWVRVFEPVEIPSRSKICVLGFSSADPLDLVVSAPDGTTTAIETETEIDGTLSGWFANVPGDPEGTYAVHAQQSLLAADTTFEVIAPTRPRALAVPESIRVGETIQVWFGGLPTGEPTPAYLYRAEGPVGWQFIADLGVVSVDDRGFGMIALTSQGSDPVDRYYLVARTALGRADVEFDLEP